MSPEVIQGLRARLEQLAREGYLIPRSQICGLFQDTDEQTPTPCITTIGIPTCDRVEALESSMSSYLENCQRFGRDPEFVVMDDSLLPRTRDECRQMLRGLKQRYGMRIAYGGMEEKLAFVHRLSEAGKIPEEVVSWACLGDRTYGASTHGANRNALLLHTVGECLFLSDDDTICRVAASPGFQEGFAIRSHWGDFVQNWYYPDRESALEAAPAVEQDILALHEQWLGHDPKVAGALYGRADLLNVEQTEPGFLRQFATQPGKIVLTLNGFIGDASQRTPDFLFFHPDESLKRQTSSEEAYRSTRISREMARVTTQPTLTRPSYIINVGGLDNRELLPPFAPVGRSEDSTFGLILGTCFPGAYSVYLPWMSLHAPPEARAYLEPIFNEGGRITMKVPFYEWLPWHLSNFHPQQVGTPAEYLSQLEQSLEQIGRLSTSAFEEFARHLLWQTDGGQISLLEQRLHKNGERMLASWRQDVETYCTQARQNMLLPVRQRLQEGAGMAQRSLVQFAQILHWWPTMVETARGLRADGIRVAQPL